jgi:hypothetical protein
VIRTVSPLQLTRWEPLLQYSCQTHRHDLYPQDLLVMFLVLLLVVLVLLLLHLLPVSHKGGQCVQMIGKESTGTGMGRR